MNLLPGRTNLIDLSISSSQCYTKDFSPPHWSRYGQGRDTEDFFKKNLETQPDDWYYRTHKVRCTMNGQWYRAKPFNTINWDESIVIFGCSQVFGIGLDDSDTISSKLQQLVDCEVVNLGVSGGCQLTSVYNMITLKNNNIKPRAIIHIWTESMRLFFINNNFQRCGAGRWNNWGINPSSGVDLFENSKTHIVSAMYNRMIANNLYRDNSNIPVIHATYFEAMWEEQRLHYPNMPITLLPRLDVARDLLHPGVETSINTANLLEQELIKAGIK